MATSRSFLRVFLLVGLVFIVFFSAEFLLEWQRLGRPGLADLSWAGNNNAKLVDVLSPMARAYNNILAMLLATIGLAIPLTANMHTPKLIDMFLRDRTNQVMLTLFAFGAAHVLWADYLIGPNFAPTWSYRLATFGAILGWAALIPYFFYVVRFLDPSNIISRLKAQVTAGVERVAAGKSCIEKSRSIIHERLHQIGTIILKSIDRADRGVVLEGIWSLKRILDHYGAKKGVLGEPWFRVERSDFVGLSAEALEIINEERTWFEHQVMRQMFLAYQSALAKSTDAISSISDATRVIATHAAARNDDKALQVMVRYFNNYLREAIKRKDNHAIYDLFYQYRLLGRDARERPQLIREIGRYFRIYSELAARSGLEFIPQLAGFDLGWLVRRAYEIQSPAAADLLGQVLALDHRAANGTPLSLLVKAKIFLGGCLLEMGHPGEAGAIRRNLEDVDPRLLSSLVDEMLAVDERTFHEVTDRQINLEWVAPERRAHLRAFVEHGSQRG
ncbi:MAG: DUF2254 family protein [Pseudomonadota bacterium]